MGACESLTEYDVVVAKSTAKSTWAGRNKPLWLWWRRFGSLFVRGGVGGELYIGGAWWGWHACTDGAKRWACGGWWSGCVLVLQGAEMRWMLVGLGGWWGGDGDGGLSSHGQASTPVGCLLDEKVGVQYRRHWVSFWYTGLRCTGVWVRGKNHTCWWKPSRCMGNKRATQTMLPRYAAVCHHATIAKNFGNDI